METTKILDQSFVNYELSSATLRPYDLINTFLRFLHLHNRTQFRRLIRNYASTGLCTAYTGEDERHDFWESDEANDLLIDLEDALNRIAPKGCYFGAIEGDGSCFGFWEDMEKKRKQELSRTFTITVDMDNDAFRDYGTRGIIELRRILDNIRCDIKDISSLNEFVCSIHDINGNTCGEYKLMHN